MNLTSNWKSNSRPHVDGKISAACTYASIIDPNDREQTGAMTTICYGRLKGEDSVGSQINGSNRVTLNPEVIPFRGIEIGDWLIMTGNFVHQTPSLPSSKNLNYSRLIQRLSTLITTD
ncbi:MAG: hypothetical protein R3A13_03090 [Bdellovibrionota bacterium]